MNRSYGNQLDVRPCHAIAGDACQHGQLTTAGTTLNALFPEREDG